MIYALLDRLFALLVSSSYEGVYVDLGSDTERNVAELAKQYMDNNKRKLSRAELAEAISYNGDYINRIFKKYTGQSVKDYNQFVYLKEAARLLKNSKISVVEITRKVGFENRTHFNKLFRQHFGLLPNEYRDSTQ